MKILFTGISGLYNYGCEAIVRGTEAIVHRSHPEAKIVYSSRNPELDQKAVCGLDMDIVQRKQYGRCSVPYLKRRVLRLFGIDSSIPYDSHKIIRDIDCLFSIGGDIYTLRHDGGYAAELVEFTEECFAQKKKVLLWGASVGPFTDNPRVEALLIEHLRKFYKIVLRERASFDYLSFFGLNNLVLGEDPAFVVGSKIVKNRVRRNGRVRIGLNLSPLCVQSVKQDYETVLTLQSKIIRDLAERFDAEILLIPHVVPPSERLWRDDDRFYQRDLLSRVESNRVSAIAEPLGFIETKKRLIDLDLMIAARMHCAINAISARVPTLLLAYSQKAIGMCVNVYQSNDFCLPIDFWSSEEKKEKLFFRVDDMLRNESELSERLDFVVPEIQKRAYAMGDIAFPGEKE